MWAVCLRFIPTSPEKARTENHLLTDALICCLRRVATCPYPRLRRLATDLDRLPLEVIAMGKLPARRTSSAKSLTWLFWEKILAPVAVVAIVSILSLLFKPVRQWWYHLISPDYVTMIMNDKRSLAQGTTYWNTSNPCSTGLVGLALGGDGTTSCSSAGSTLCNSGLNRVYS
jgi:hypothetical protein